MKKRYSGKTPGRFTPIYNLLTFICLLYAFAGNAQCVSLTTLGSASTQSFNTLANTGTTNNLTITGWFMTESGGSARDNEQYAFDDGGDNTGDTYSYGVDGNAERALGQLGSGTLTPIFGSCFTNNTGATITSLDINYFGEQWRIANTGAARDDRMDFQYSLNAASLTTGTWVDVNALDFTNPIKTAMSVGALDGNNVANRTNIISSITGLSIANGATFWIRWTDINVTNNDDGLAVDDFSLTPQSAPMQPNLTINDIPLNEGNAGTTSFIFTVSLSAPAGPGGVTFDIATADGTGEDDNPSSEDNDYVANSLAGQTIPAGSSTYSFTVLVNGDVTVESNETFFVNVTNVVGATVVDGQGQGTIQNDDVAPAATITTIASSLNPSFTGNNVIFTATVTSSGNPVTTGTVDFKEGAITLASNVALNGSGQASFATAALSEGSHNITAFYNGATGFNTSSGSMVQVVNNMTIVNGNNFCNTGNITLNDGNSGGEIGTPGTPYPSNILVSGLVGTIQSITVDVKGLTHPRASDIDLLLIAPTGETFLMMTGVGQFGTFSNTNLTLSDAAGSALPQIGGIPSGTYRPTSYEADNRNIFPAPAPAGPYNKPAPQGAATFASVFNGLDPNGTWQLYATDDTLNEVGSIANGWCLNIVVPTCTPPSISDEPDAITACAGSATAFTVAATGAGTLSYQWQEDGVDLMNTGVYSNVNTATLNISDVTGLNGKKYKVIITNDNGTPDDASDDCSSTSEEVILTVLDPQAGTLGATNPVICEGGDLGLTHTGFSGVNNFGTLAFRKSDGSFVAAGSIDGPNSAIEQAIEAAGPGEYCIIAFAQFTKPGDFETGACGINENLTAFYFAPLDAFRACLQDQLDKGVCVDWDEFCVTVNPKPDISASATSMTICNGETTTLNFMPTTDLTVVGWFLDDDDAGCNPMGASLSTGITFDVSPGTTTTYAVVVQNSDGCRDTACVTITVNPKPDITASATETTICVGETTTLNFTPTTDLTVVGWFLDDDDAVCNPMGASLSTGTTFEVSPGTTTTYAVVVQNSDGCRDTACVTITVNPIPTATVTAMSPICPGEDAVFTITATPNTSVYANLNGGNPPSPPFLGGDSIHIGASGMAIITIPNAMVNQTLSLYQVANYAPIYYQTSCRIVNIDESATVVISSNLNITAGATQTTICNGETTTLNFTPTSDLTVVGWFLDDDDAGCNPMGGSLSTGTTFEVSPNSTTTYAVVVQNSDGCRDTACVTITVNPKPDITADATQTTICAGETTTLNFTPTTDLTVVGWFLDDAAAGCNPMGGSLNTGTTFEVSPNSTTTYAVVVQNSDGCRDTACVTITVNPLPTITLGANPKVCAGETSVELTFTATTGDPNQYSIDFVDASFTDVTDVALGSSPIVIAIPANATAGMYAATLTVRNSTTGCSQTYNISVQVLDCNIIVRDPCSCKNNATTLVNGQFNETVAITAPSGQTWTVTAVANLYQTTSPAPPAAPTLITIGTAFVETPNGDGTSTYTLVGLMVDATSYSLTVTNGRGSTRMVDNICYYPNPAITGLDPAYCADEPAVILTGTIDRGDGQTAIPPQSAVFDINGTVATQFDPQALGAGTYTVGFTVDAAAEGANFPGCVQAVSQQVRVDPQVTVDAGTPQTICRTKTLALSALNASVQYSGTVADLIYTWSFVEAGNNGTLSGTSSTNLNAGTYTPGPAAIARGYVTLRLTVDNPNDACEAVTDTVRVNILNVDCGQFPWNGNN